MDPFITGPILLALVEREVIGWIVRRSLQTTAPKLEDVLKNIFNRELTEEEKTAIERKRLTRINEFPSRGWN